MFFDKTTGIEDEMDEMTLGSTQHEGGYHFRQHSNKISNKRFFE